MLLRFDSVGGASGDMLLACLADLGADLDTVAKQIQSALPDHFHIRRETLTLDGLRGTRVSVDLHEHQGTRPHETSHVHTHGENHDHTHDHGHDDNHHSHGASQPHKPDEKPQGRHHRNLPAILRMIEGASLPAPAAVLAASTFQRLAEAEAAVHGTTVEKVHFHEVGAADAIVDILGSCLALEQLGVTEVSVGPLPEGEGTLTCEHGVMPIPAPATAELLRGHPVVRVEEPCELVTPTGAALLMTWKAMCPARAAYTAIRHGIGFGRRTLRSRPNLIRATLAESHASGEAASGAPGDVMLLEANLDDCPGEWLGSALERMLAHGALDVWFTAIQMKKNRPGTQVSVLCEPERAATLKSILFAETTTFGIRERIVHRTVLDRRIETVQTRYGAVRIKIGSLQGADVLRQPEYEDCARLAGQHGVSVRTVSAAVRPFPEL